MSKSPAKLPVPTTSAVMPVRLREDLPREVADAYWTNQHADIVRRLPHVLEYTQHHFSATDHGYWPRTGMVGTIVPPSWPIDGIAETRFSSLAASLLITLRMREVFFDEQNPFEMVLGNMTGPRGGRWWTTGLDDSVGHRTVLLLRRRRGVSGRSFRSFVHDRLGPALDAAGARDLRTYTYIPYVAATYSTPGVSHHNPPHRRYHASVVLGTDTRADVEALIASPEVTAVVEDQHLFCTGVHAFTVERRVPGIRITAGAPQ